MSGSIRFIRFGAKIGSNSLRYFECSGGSTCSGMSGTDCPRSTASMAEEKTSGCCSANSTSLRPMIE